MRILDSSLFSAPSGIFCATWAEAHYRFSGSHSAVAAFAAVIAGYLFYASVAMWVVSDARERAYPLPYDFGSLVFLFAAIFGAIYVFSTRGLRGFVPILGLAALTFAGAAAGMCSCLVFSILRRVFT
jgi:hypothetical protein